MIVARTFDAGFVNAVVNSPDVRPFVGPGGELDLSEAVAKPENWFLMGEHGGFLLAWSAPGVHEVHTFILKSGRGDWACDAALATIRFATENGATMLWTKIPADQPNVSAFAYKMGMRETGQFVETFNKPYAVSSMELRRCQ